MNLCVRVYVCMCYVCISVCVYVHVCICASVCISVFMCVCVYVCTCVCMFVCVSVCACVCMCMCVCVCICVFTHICVCACVYIRVCLYAHLSVSVCMCASHPGGARGVFCSTRASEGLCTYFHSSSAGLNGTSSDKVSFRNRSDTIQSLKTLEKKI